MEDESEDYVEYENIDYIDGEEESDIDQEEEFAVEDEDYDVSEVKEEELAEEMKPVDQSSDWLRAVEEALNAAKGPLTVIELDLDRDDGAQWYEGEAELDGRRYEFEMSASGRIVEWERD